MKGEGGEKGKDMAVMEEVAEGSEKVAETV